MISIIVSMYDRSRRAAVSLEEITTVGELLAQCMERWQLPTGSFAFRAVATNVREAVVPNYGHWLMEESPAYTVALIRDYLKDPTAASPK